MRRVVGTLRDPDGGPVLAPQPSLSRVDALVAHARETGLPVDLEIEGEPVSLPAGLDLTAYRLVQEGLTNAINHAAAAHAEVRVRYDDGHVEIEVSDDGRGKSGDAPSNGGGHGLVGMRERVSIYGGELEQVRAPRAGSGSERGSRYEHEPRRPDRGRPSADACGVPHDPRGGSGPGGRGRGDHGRKA